MTMTPTRPMTQSARNIAASALPKDIAAAVVAGRVGATEVAAWAALYKGIFRKLFAALWLGPGVRNRCTSGARNRDVRSFAV